MSISGNFDTHLENGGAAQKTSIGEGCAGTCGAMVDRSQWESFESSKRTNTRLLEVDEFEELSSLKISQRLCVPFFAQSHCCPSETIAHRSVNVKIYFLQSPFFLLSPKLSQRLQSWLAQSKTSLHLLNCINHLQVFRKVLMLGAGFIARHSRHSQWSWHWSLSWYVCFD